MIKMAKIATNKKMTGRLGLHSPVATMQILDMGPSAKPCKSTGFKRRLG
jgi:hypothetical protein